MKGDRRVGRGVQSLGAFDQPSAADVSVVIPTHNRLWSLRKAIDSCRSDRCRVQIIVVDDGSTDGTHEWLQTQKDLEVIRSQHWGKCWAVNEGVQRAEGEFIRFLDSDDWLEAGSNQRQLEVGRKEKSDVITGGQIHVYDDGRKSVRIPDDRPLRLSEYLAQASTSKDASCSAHLFRRGFVAGIPRRQEYPWEDILFMSEVTLRCPRTAHLREVVLWVREHAMDARMSHEPKGMAAKYENWQTARMYMRLWELAAAVAPSDCAARSALLDGVWQQARAMAKWDVREARNLFEWVRAAEPNYVPRVKQSVRIGYRFLGPPWTDKILAMMRFWSTP
jgi:glycosyltransferase involved in cell wall biosynthesis